MKDPHKVIGEPVNETRTGTPPRYDDYDVVCPHPSCPEGFYTKHDEHAVVSLVYHLRSDHEALYEGLRTKLGVTDR